MDWIDNSKLDIGDNPADIKIDLISTYWTLFSCSTCQTEIVFRKSKTKPGKICDALSHKNGGVGG